MPNSTAGRVIGEARSDPGWWLSHRAHDGDPDAASAVVLLFDPMFATDARVWRHVDDRQQLINWERILKQGTWSSGELALLKLGRNLWCGGRETAVDVTSLTDLGDGLFELALDAIAARRGSSLRALEQRRRGRPA